MSVIYFVEKSVMEFPKLIHDFMLHDVLGDWHYKGQELVSAHYLKVGSRMSLYIRTIADVSGQQKFEIQLRDSYISGILTLEDAIRIATEIIEENRLFIDDHAL
jgi:hypothetical protein